jgi:hypothetical protein
MSVSKTVPQDRPKQLSGGFRAEHAWETGSRELDTDKTITPGLRFSNMHDAALSLKFALGSTNRILCWYANL